MLAGLPSAAILSCNGASSVENHHLSKRLSLFFFKLVLLFWDNCSIPFMYEIANAERSHVVFKNPVFPCGNILQNFLSISQPGYGTQPPGYWRYAGHLHHQDPSQPHLCPPTTTASLSPDRGIWCPPLQIAHFDNVMQMESYNMLPFKTGFFHSSSSSGGSSRLRIPIVPFYHWLVFRVLYITACSIIYPVKDIWVVSSLGLLGIKLLKNIRAQF